MVKRTNEQGKWPIRLCYTKLMKRARGHAGYTILETMIFLVISGALLSSATILFDGRIQRAQFTQGVQQLDAHIRSTISEVASGTYTDDNTFYCRLTASGPQVGTASFEENQGTRQACIFAGKVTHFAITSDGSPPCTESGGAITADSECSLVNTYTTVGLRTDFSQPTFTSAIQSKPVPINGFTSGGGNPDLIDLTSHYPLNNGH
jgi:type II secretory pathway pseudopilin PulG